MWTKLNPESSRKASAENHDDVERVSNTLLTIAEPGSSFSYLSGGASNHTFIKRRGKNGSVLRFFGRGDHALEESRVEADLLHACFPTKCVVDCLEFIDQELAVLEMNFLSSADPSPSEVWELQVHYQSAIASSGREGLFPDERDISALVARARLALANFTDDDQLTAAEVALSTSLLENLADFLVEAPRVPCHGDLSPGNVLQGSSRPGDQSGLVALDWEDRFWGVRDYDFLYWLTFMANAPYVTRESLRISDQPHEICVALLLVIVLLKEYITLSSGITLDGRLPAVVRLRHVLELM